LHNPTEAELWAELWASPQAAAWEQMGPPLRRVVARYVRWQAAAEQDAPADVAASVLTELRQLEDRLGLTPMALARLRWDILAPDEAGPPDPPLPPPPPADLPMRPAQRRRVRAQDGDH
jgi:hypothetical protein